ncbi:hypothetical protein PHYC_01502 [Phycisphaerales bacterium]|nr:hypothetical protein PHYC_01502 [Phycisphaerales bacterium]
MEERDAQTCFEARGLAIFHAIGGLIFGEVSLVVVEIEIVEGVEFSVEFGIKFGIKVRVEFGVECGVFERVGRRVSCGRRLGWRRRVGRRDVDGRGGEGRVRGVEAGRRGLPPWSGGRRRGIEVAAAEGAEETVGGAAGGLFVLGSADDVEQAVDGVVLGLEVEVGRALAGSFFDGDNGGGDVRLSGPVGELGGREVEGASEVGEWSALVKPGVEADVIGGGQVLHTNTVYGLNAVCQRILNKNLAA